ncbi:hypothetical protein BsWGS_18709 [Bradybaena similaris]
MTLFLFPACTAAFDTLSVSGDSKFRYDEYKRTYTNCTYVVGNLQILFLEEPESDLSFLSQIREVTGYVLLIGNKVDYIPLHNLQIIRGTTLFHYNKTNEYFSLFVTLNYDADGDTTQGLKELGFKSLSEILNGKVLFQNNNQLCFEESISWTDVNPTSNPPVKYINDSKKPRRQCAECHESCYNNITKHRHCWGAGPDMCQKLSYGVVCHGNCGDNRCYGSLPNQCCHQECAGGCTGPKKTDCFACRSFKDENDCVSYCPKDVIYNKNLMINEKNPDVKYTFGSLCLKKCPDFLLQDGSSCVRHCSEGRHADDQRVCKPCNGPCPKKCNGTEPNQFLNSNNSNQFDGCTTIDGNLRILTSSFNRDAFYGYEALHPNNLTVLKSVKEITGYLLIQSTHEEFTDLSFLSSLQIIHGRTLAEPNGNALSILQTPLKSLDLVSLKQISNGHVLIAVNSKLCYADTIDWREILKRPDQKIDIRSNRARTQCEIDGEVCDDQCGVTGCWGKGPDKCLKCANYFYEEKNLCLNKCTDHSRLYHSGLGKCAQCHIECYHTCSGPNNTDCDRCANVIMRNKVSKDTCEQNCGPVMYPDSNKICQQCHPNCGDNGCTGPGKHVGEGGCNACELGVRSSNKKLTQCLSAFNQSCGDGYFLTYSYGLNGGRQYKVCEECHEYCLTCNDHMPKDCDSCRYFRKDDYCVKECPSFEFGNPLTKLCVNCHSECRTGCYDATSAGCMACANFKIYFNAENKSQFNCTSECPSHLPYHVKESDTDENRVVCADISHPEVKASQEKNAQEERQKLTIILAVTVPVAIFLVMLFSCIAYLCHKRAQNNRKAAEYTAKIAGFEEIEPMTPTNVKPDLAQMRIISESELRKGTIIGSGAFGTVYKGIWIPQGENVKIPVAIKVLQEGTSPGQSTELLEEARVMYSVDNINCVRILAVCMKSQMMLVTQLMPHGNLLNYVRTNAQHIGSKALLNWCTQIARGMAYLEDRGIVHRDLAARNVLVQTPNQVKITDFGLAKLLDMDSPEYHSQGGLMPIKWLALECILHRIFTHKSDVWSFGVTIWELFTLGKKPYDGIRTKDVPTLLEKGERLNQPGICTIDVYMIMVKCWMLDAESRPSFKELQEEFAKMSRDPGRYLVIEGDSLMRLPSVSYDKNDLIHEIGGGGSESVMEAEEYLSPVEHTHQQHRPNSLIRIYDRQHSNMSAVSSRTPVEHPEFANGAKGGVLRSDSQKVREKTYGHLTAAARAKQERELPQNRDNSISSRYSSDPIKYLRDKEEIDWNQADLQDSRERLPQKPLSPNAMKMFSNFVLPVDEEDYLRPGAAAQSLAYLDLDGKGYYQNEKDTKASNDDSFADDDDDTLHELIYSSVDNSGEKDPHRQGDKSVASVAVANPDYFEENGTDVWEQKKPLLNGYHLVPNSSTSPVHISNKDNLNSYYRSMNGTAQSSPEFSQKVNTKVTMPGLALDNPVSKV